MRLAAPAVVLLALGTAVAVTPAQQTVRSGVDLVEVAVHVRDRDGQLFRDLTARDFQIFEGNTPQVIAGFEQVSLPVRAPAAGPVTLPAVAFDVASNERTGESRVFILVLDALHVGASRTRVVRDYARQFIERHVGPADLVAVVSPGGLTSATQDFTSDKTRLLAAVGSVRRQQAHVGNG